MGIERWKSTFKILLKQKSKLKRDKQIRFSKSNLGDAIDHRKSGAKKKSCKNEQKFIFLFLLKIKIEILNSFFYLITKKKIELFFKMKIKCPFRPMNYLKWLYGKNLLILNLKLKLKLQKLLILIFVLILTFEF